MVTKRCIWVLSLLIISCSSANLMYEEETMQGVFVQKEYEGIQLRLDKSSFLFIDTYKQEHLPPYDCCDTLAYGNWKIDERGFISLSSPEELSTYYLNMEVDETQGFSKDSLYFIIDNPIESYYRKTNRKKKDIQYKIGIGSNKDHFNQPFWYKRYSTNAITVAKTEDLKLYSFDITTLADPEISLKNLDAKIVYTLRYDIKNPEANVFKINIPDLSFGYLSYRRLDNDYVKIVNKNKLLWDGKEYIKK